ncbi:MAG: hypothetical protein KTR35_22695, partial [Gammaproteobacteria bacterium]|nr:hypothetical protein [Gammaproteobacteria bacterium]
MEVQRSLPEVYVRKDVPFGRNISIHASRLLLAVLVLIILAACQIPGPGGSTDAGVDLSQFAMDSTVGSYGSGREDRLIMVTIALDKHAELINMTSSTATGVEQSSGIVLPERYVSPMNDW